MRRYSQYAVDAAVRAVCTAHYAKRFGLPPDDPQVIANVDANRQVFLEDVQTAIFAYVDALTKQQAVIIDREFTDEEIRRLEALTAVQWGEIRPATTNW